MEKLKNHLKDNKTIINQSVVSALDELFQFSSPDQLKSSLMEIFFNYLCNTEPQEYKAETKEIANDFYFLLKFLEIAERNKKENGIK